MLKCFVNDSEILLNSFQKLFNEIEMFFNELSSSSKIFGSQKNTKGAAAAFVAVFFSDPTIVQTAA